jgi:phage/plasmid-like protein (TIGR03299 family)
MVESMFSAGDAPWHRLGVRVEHELTSREAIETAGLSWRVRTAPLVATTAEDGRGLAHSDGAAVDGYRAVLRETDRHVLGVVGKRYCPIQNSDAFTFFDEVVGAGQAVYHTAGSLEGGKRIWILAKMKGEVRIGHDDVIEKYLLLASSHDGSSALRMLPTPVRVVCQNTLNLALEGGVGEGVSIRHTATAGARMEQAARVLRVAHGYYDTFQIAAEQFANQRFSDEQMRALAVALYPDHETEPSTRSKNVRDQLVSLFEGGIGHREHGIEGTAWAALNAVAEHADHHRQVRSTHAASDAEAKLSSSWFGSGAALKRQAYAVISRQLAA